MANDVFPALFLRGAQADIATQSTSHDCRLEQMTRADPVLADPPAALGVDGMEIVLHRGGGARLTGVDGVDVLDLCMGYGTQLLGHGHPAVASVLREQIDLGWALGPPTESQVTLARLVQAAGPANERVVFCTSGSDAILLAMRAARAFTGKDIVGLFAGSFHGLHDYGLVSGEPDPGEGLGLTRKVHLGAGIPRVIDQAVSVMPYGHPAVLDLIRRQRHELAAIVVEAVRGSEPHLDAGPWLQELAQVCRQSSVLLVLDETTTGFRLAYGGAQEVFGIAPDLVTYGKAVGGGLPLGVVAGRADVMRVFAGERESRGIFAASTFAGNPLSIGGGLGALQFVHANRAQFYLTLDRRTARLARGFTAAAADLDVPARMQRAGSIFRIALGARPRTNTASARRLEDTFASATLRRGVLLQRGLRGYVSAAHTDDDIDAALAAFTTTLADMKADGAFVGTERH